MCSSVRFSLAASICVCVSSISPFSRATSLLEFELNFVGTARQSSEEQNGRYQSTQQQCEKRGGIALIFKGFGGPPWRDCSGGPRGRRSRPRAPGGAYLCFRALAPKASWTSLTSMLTKISQFFFSKDVRPARWEPPVGAPFIEMFAKSDPFSTLSAPIVCK